MLKMLFATLTTAIMLVGCTGAVTPTPIPPTPTPTPDELLDRAAQAVSAMTSAQFSLTREGASAVLDPSTHTIFTEATGQYQAPNRVSASVKVSAGETVFQLEMRWLPEGNYITNPLTQTWTKMPPDFKFNGAAVFGPEGMASVLKDGIENVTLVGAETVEDQEAYHLKGEAAGDKVAPITAGLLSAEASYPVEVWMETSLSNVVRVHIAEPDGSGWVIDLFDINRPVDIKAP